MSTSSYNYGNVSDRPKSPLSKRVKADDQSHEGMAESSQVIEKSNKRNFSEILHFTGMARDKSDALSVLIPAFRCDDGETTADVPTASNLKDKEESLEDELKLPRFCKTLQNINFVGKRRRSHAGKRSSLRSPVQISSNINCEAADPSSQTMSSQVNKKSSKGKSLEEHLQSVDDTLLDCETPAIIGRCSSAGKLMLERDPGLVADRYHSRSRVDESITPNCEVRPHPMSTPPTREHSHEHGTPGLNSSCGNLGEGSEQQAKEANLSSSLVEHEAADLIPTTDLVNGKEDPSSTENPRKRRKKFAIRTPSWQQKTRDLVSHYCQNCV